MRHAPHPKPEDIKSLRARAGMTQSEFGNLTHATVRTVHAWESGARVMPAAKWELTCIRLAAYRARATDPTPESLP